MDHSTLMLVTVIALVLTAEFINGWTDAPNVLATVVTTGALPVKIAVPGAVLLNALGAASGIAVATTIGKDIVVHGSVTVPTIGAAMIAVIFWGGLAANRGWPVSKSHALLAGIAGAAIAGGGFQALIWHGWKLVLYGMLASLIAGFVVALVFGSILIVILVRVAPNPAKRIVDYVHIFFYATAGFVHGRNDAQKFMGITAMVISIHFEQQGFGIPWWIIAVCSLTMGAGTAFGGWRIITTVGKKMGDIESWHGLVAMMSASSIIEVASAYGAPISTTHTITASIVGANSSHSLSRVKWAQLADIAKAWALTFPCCGAIAFCAASVVLYAPRLWQ